jgi:hypothetical protein
LIVGRFGNVAIGSASGAGAAAYKRAFSATAGDDPCIGIRGFERLIFCLGGDPAGVKGGIAPPHQVIGGCARGNSGT